MRRTRISASSAASKAPSSGSRCSSVSLFLQPTPLISIPDFGFVARMDNGEEIFVHASSIVQSGRIQRGLNAEQEVEMDVSVGPKGLQAIAVTSPGGYPIEDTEPLILRYNRSRRKSLVSMCLLCVLGPIKKDEAVPEGKGQPKPRGESFGLSVIC